MMTKELHSRFRVTGMDCAACAVKVEVAVRRLAAVREVAVSATAGSMTLRHAPVPALLEELRTRLAPLGYGVAPATPEAPAAPAGAHTPACTHSPRHDHGQPATRPDSGETPWWRSGKGRLTLACALGLAAAYGLDRLLPEAGRWAFLAAMLAGLVPIARRAVASARLGLPFSIETLMTVAAVGAVAIGATAEAAAVVLLFLVGELLEGVAAARARAGIRGLAALVPKTARRERDGTVEAVAAEALAVGDTILVRPGDRIPADGAVLSGESSVDEAPVTGESQSKAKGPGAAVFAGTINGEGLLRLRVGAEASDNTIARIVRLVEEAQEGKAPTQRLIDRFARVYTPAIVLLAALVAVLPPLLAGADWDAWIYKGLALLLIGCPCALVISTPAAIAAALSAGARRGLLMKGGATLEMLGKVTFAAFDKTGTLTEGRPRVTDLVGLGRPEGEVLALAAALERGSSHPLALAILARAAAEGLPAPAADDSGAVPGKGITGRVAGERLFLGSPAAAAERAALGAQVEARIAALSDEGKTVAVLLAGPEVAGPEVAGLIALRDEPRADAAEGIAALRDLGLGVVMLTGDDRRVAAAIAAPLGLEARAGLLPQDKQRIVRGLQAEGRVVAKVGDGINDAPALAAADVGIAMGGGSDVALETADAAVLHGRVLDVARMIRLSRLTLANIRQNVAVALGLKVVFLASTLLGLTGLWPAILADTGATVLVTLNALRLLRVRLD